jgi:uncharacterized protein YmfQ (DUF2313 family)
MGGRDAAESLEASETPDLAAQLDSVEDEIAELLAACTPGNAAKAVADWHRKRTASTEGQALADATRMVAAALWGRGDANIRLAALAYVGGLECTVGKSMAQFAREIGCSRAAISKEANLWSDKLGIRSKCMKSQAARDTYSRNQRARLNKQPSKSLT